jgi:putative FmdB family regulatory protein
MPIYEFYCGSCHTMFSFLSRRVDTSKRPACPRCGRPQLERRTSRFAVSKGRPEPTAGGSDVDDLDDARMDQAMDTLGRDAEGVDENDPRQVAGLMRRFYGATGLQLGGTMEEAIRRMEAGEDPDAIESELGEALEQEDPFGGGEGGSTDDLPRASGRLKRLSRRLRPPAVDRTLYEM